MATNPTSILAPETGRSTLLRVGDIARATGKTVRAIHLYEELGLLRPVMDRVFPLAEAAAAHARMEEGGHIGKIVLQVG